MAVAGLVLGILGFVIFSWGGPVLGMVIAGGSTLTSSLSGPVEISATPVWIFGLIAGVGFPLIAVGLSIAGLVREDNKGVAVAGLVLGAVAAIIGLIVTFLLAAGLDMAKKMTDPDNPAALQSLPELDAMQKQLNDPSFQQQIQEAMKRAAEMQQVTGTPPPVQAVPDTPPPPPAPGAQPPPAAPPTPNPPAGAPPPSTSPAPADPPGAPAPQ